jgi:hypothetical protein
VNLPRRTAGFSAARPDATPRRGFQADIRRGAVAHALHCRRIEWSLNYETHRSHGLSVIAARFFAGESAGILE